MQLNLRHIPYFSSAADQGGQSKEFPWFYGTPLIDMSASTFNGLTTLIGGAKLGDAFWLRGNCFKFVKADSALAIGDLVTPTAATTGTITVPTSNTKVLLTNINNAATVAANGDVGNYLWGLITGATEPELRRIKGNTSSATASYTVSLKDYTLPSLPYDKDVLDTTPTNADPVIIIRPNNVTQCDATHMPIGVALGTVTQYNYTLIQIAGLAVLNVDANGANEDIALGEPVVPAAAGCVKGLNATASPWQLGSQVQPLYATNAASGLFPFYINFIGA